MTAMTPEAYQAFLAETRVAILTMLTEAGGPVAVPVWYEWDGQRARIFTGAESRKVRRLQRDPRVSLLVARPAGEPEEWVALDGTITIYPQGAIALAELLAERYWDLSNESHAATLQSWRDQAETLRVLELTPTKIRSSV